MKGKSQPLGKSNPGAKSTGQMKARGSMVSNEELNFGEPRAEDYTSKKEPGGDTFSNQRMRARTNGYDGKNNYHKPREGENLRSKTTVDDSLSNRQNKQPPTRSGKSDPGARPGATGGKNNNQPPHRDSQRPSSEKDRNSWGQHRNENTRGSHPRRNPDSSVDYEGRTDDVSFNIRQFWNKLGQTNRRQGDRGRGGNNDRIAINLSNHDDRSLWYQTWSAAAAGVSGSLQHLVDALLMLPKQQQTTPPHLDVVKVLIRILKTAPRADVMHKVVNVIRDRLKGASFVVREHKPSLLEDLQELKRSFQKSMAEIICTDLEAGQGLMQRIPEIDAYSREVLILPEADADAADMSELSLNDATAVDISGWQGWTAPTVGWLASAKWHQVRPLRDHYEDSEDYANVLRELWTLLSFFWGTGAVFPHCSHSPRGDVNSNCGEPLLCRAGSQTRCTMRVHGVICDKPAIWKCYRRDHNAICSVCLSRYQLCLLGEPGLGASTDIYDAIVDRETTRPEGLVFMLSSVKSRKPPKIPPNWRTSYRLQVSVLVGIVRLGFTGEKLSRNQTIQWAEVVQYVTGKDGFSEESRHRSDGRMAIRLLGRGDCSAMALDADSPLEAGGRVAIIDLRVFVPEVVSVLSTLSDYAFLDHMSEIPFMDHLIGRGTGSRRSIMSDVVVQSNWPRAGRNRDAMKQIIEAAVFRSDIEFIGMMDGERKSRLVDKIFSLPQVKTLYGTQLEAFICGLSSAVHCTQGPPGTGKSYIGVCLVVALDLIRSAAIEAGYSVGPILVLSYKNHALDEFLLDVKNSSHSQTYTRGKLIRCGKPENEELKDFAESRSPEEYRAQQELAGYIHTVRQSRRIERDFKECSSYLFGGTLQWPVPKASMPVRITDETIRTGLTVHSASTAALTNAFICVGKLIHLCSELVNSSVPRNERYYSDAISDLQGKISCHQAFKALQNLESIDFMTSTAGLDSETFANLISFMTSVEAEIVHWKEEDRKYALSTLWNSPSLAIPTAPAWNLFLVLDTWLRGENPPARCSARENNAECLEYAEGQLPYCKLFHCCMSTLGCPNKRVIPVVPFCNLHNCIFGSGEGHLKPCGYERLEKSNYCGQHSCPVCVVLERPIVKAASPKACRDHKCAGDNRVGEIQGDQWPCENPREHPHSYCETHLCRECSETGTVTDRPKISKDFCILHKCQLNDCNKRKVREESLSMDGNIVISFYCELHSCRACIRDGCLVVSRVDGPSGLCSNHRCTHFSKCHEERVQAQDALYCDIHSCRVCLERGLPCSNSTVEDFPRNVCDNHKLCGHVQEDGTLCDLLAAEPFCILCDVHAVEPNAQTVPKNTAMIQDTYVDWQEVQCSGISKNKKKRCGTKGFAVAGKEWYCYHHEDQAGPEPTPQAIVPDKPGLPTKGKKSEEGTTAKIPAGNKANETKGDSSGDLLKDAVGKDAKKRNLETLRSRSSAILQSKHPQNILPPPNVAKVADNEEEVEEDLSEFLDFIQENNIGADVVDSNVGVAGVDADELDIPDFEAFVEEQEENENVAHLKEVDELPGDEADEFASDGESEQERSIGDGFVQAQTAPTISVEEVSVYDIYEELSKWSFEMTIDERHHAAAQFLRWMSQLLHILRSRSESLVALARKNRAEAAATAFKRARIIGATVVGASRRLEALRAAEPFAVVVEEACEVMEPTLMSVLAVKSLRKLELIGDHRQLPAFVQNGWFSLEMMHPCIKKSLFERMVSVPTNNSAGNSTGYRSFTVLDEQRRMRPVISDITRPDYRDLVVILDHEKTLSKRIGDLVVDNDEKRELQTHLEVWPNKGRDVPGMGSCLYFWDLENSKEGRAAAGLSACNTAEADAVVALTKWLRTCGAPSSTITIITPYKGQKSTIISRLRDAQLITRDQKCGLIVSTVDRYQGDENDIVILSMVRTQPGNRFIELRNRFIVAASRARIGFFVIGSVNGVSTSVGNRSPPEHWSRFVAELRNSNSPMIDASSLPSSVALDTCQGCYEGARIGSQIPICCPFHPSQTVKIIRKPSEFPSRTNWTAFCRIPCEIKIKQCGHLCGKSCHSPLHSEHTPKTSCRAAVPRPCSLHAAVPLECQRVKITKDFPSFSEALRNYECEVIVKYRRSECGHEEDVSCNDKKRLDDKRVFFTQECAQNAPPFILQCGHRIDGLSCFQRRQYETSPPLCEVKVPYQRPCGCVLTLLCKEACAEKINPPKCQMAVNCPRPRCGHQVSLRCHVASTMRKYKNERDHDDVVTTGSAVTVECGKDYGRSEKDLFQLPECEIPVLYRRLCGHSLERIPCKLAFEYCATETRARNSARDALLSSTQTLPPPCEERVSIRNPLCNHTVEVPCWAALQSATWDPWRRIPKPLVEIDGRVVVHETSLYCEPDPAPQGLTQVLERGCRSHVIRVKRWCHETHFTEIPCKDLLNVMNRRKPLSDCIQKVNRMLPCGHFTAVRCCDQSSPVIPVCQAPVSDVFYYACRLHSVSALTCDKYRQLKEKRPACQVPVPAWRFRCYHTAKVPCHMKEALEETLPGGSINCARDKGCVVAGTRYCGVPANAPVCTDLVAFKNSCGHTTECMPCHLAFDYAMEIAEAPSCVHVVTKQSPLCGHSLQFPCGLIGDLDRWDPWRGDEIPGVDAVYRLGERLQEVYSRCIHDFIPRPVPLPATISWGRLHCDSSVSFHRSCGHSIQLPCVDAFSGRIQPCQEVVRHSCSDPNRPHEKLYVCHQYSDLTANGGVIACQEIVEKLCILCEINIAPGPCSSTAVHCERNVTAALGCGHEVKWKCGFDQDPRVAETPCLSCVRESWRTHLQATPSALIHKNNNVSPEDTSRLVVSLRALISRKLEGMGEFTETMVFDVPEAAVVILCRNYCNILKATCDLIGLDKARIIDKTPPPDIICADEVTLTPNFDICFMTLNDVKRPNNQSDLPKHVTPLFTGTKPTLYGQGIRLTVLSDKSLQGVQPDESGVLRLCIGVAYKYQTLEDTPPFIPQQPNKNNNQRGKNKEDVQVAANRLMRDYKLKGYDSVDVKDARPGYGGYDRVYWHAGSVIPLGLYEIRMHRPCGICMEHFLERDGVSCHSRHFLCWECFGGYINSAMEPGAIQRSVDKEGNLSCPDPKCKSKYSAKNLAAAGGTEEMMDKFINLKVALNTQKAVESALAEQKERLTKEHERIMQIKDSDERTAHSVKMNIMETMLNLRCPRCHVVFVDFEGCFALTCVINNCGAGFCAWCLEDCGADAHAHVRECPHRPPGVVSHNGTLELFNEHHRKRKERLVRDRVRAESKAVQAFLIRLLEPDLRDLGITLA